MSPNFQLSLDKVNIRDYKAIKRGVFSFKDDYIFDVIKISNYLAVSSSTNEIKLFDSATFVSTKTLEFHKDTITSLKKWQKNNEELLLSSSKDGTIALWDLRTQDSPVKVWNSPGGQILSFDMNSTGNVLAGGTELKDSIQEAKILFWDTRSDGLVNQFTESHNNDITTLHFHPILPYKLLSGGMDGLVCTFSLEAQNEDDSLDKVINIGASVSQADYFGNDFEYIYTMSHMETFALWTHEGDSVHDFGNMKQASIGGFTLDYGFKTYFDPETRRLFYFGGSFSGEIGIYLVNGNGELKLYEVLEKAHTDVVRTILWDSESNTFISGAEDGKIFRWSRPPIIESSQHLKFGKAPQSMPKRVFSPY